MELRDFTRFHLLKVLLGLAALQLVIFAFVQNYNHRPIAVQDIDTLIQGHTLTIAPMANDTDKDEIDQLALKQIETPAHGKVRQSRKLIEYTAEQGFVGADSFAYTISDGRKESKRAFITLEVLKNLPPVANHDVAVMYGTDGAIIDVLGNDYDKEVDSLFIKEVTAPVHGKVSISGNQIAYTANPTFLKVDSFTYISSDGINSSGRASVVIQVKSKTDPCYPWLTSDVGNVRLSGSLSCTGKTFDIEASGSDIWDNCDGFHFAYQWVSADAEIYTKVESLTGTHDWAKAGVMIRETLAGDSKMAFVGLTNVNGVATNHRVLRNTMAESGEKLSTGKAPYWVKLVRTGNYISYFVSANGHNWQSLGGVDITMGSRVCIGFAVSSHDNNNHCIAKFSRYAIKE